MHPLCRLKWLISTGDQSVCCFSLIVAENVGEDMGEAHVLGAFPWFLEGRQLLVAFQFRWNQCISTHHKYLN